MNSFVLLLGVAGCGDDSCIRTLTCETQNLRPDAGVTGSGEPVSGSSGTGGTAGSENDAGIGGDSSGGQTLGSSGTGAMASCNEVPCRNGATCSEEGDGFSCSCLPGYSGESCEVNTDDCAGSPCQNDGTCVDGVNGYTCQCPLSFAGDTCERPVQGCQDEPCQNGGGCTDADDGYVCSCLDGFEGLQCETNIDDCLGAGCENDSACVDLVLGFECQCRPGYTGELCDENIDDCAGDPCLNGLCLDAIDGFSCDCTGTGFEGDLCETNIDDCTLASCENGGICEDGALGFSCDCTGTGFEGDLCETNIDDCTLASCENGGTCEDGVLGFTCGCAGTGFHGEVCEVPTLRGLGRPSAFISCLASAVSGDGSTVVGTCGSGVSSTAFRWVNGVYQTLLAPSDTDTQLAIDVSEDGQVVVGRFSRDFVDSQEQLIHGARGARWVGDAQAVELLPTDPTSRSFPGGVSLDGSVSVGYASGFDSFAPLRWLPVEPERLNIQTSNSPIGVGVSGDGVVALGQDLDGSDAWRWTVAGGQTVLPSLLVGARSRPYAASRNGSVIVGESNGEPVRWPTVTSVVSLNPGVQGIARSVSGDGTVVVGESGGQAFIWTQATGLQPALEVIAAAGGATTGWELTSALDVSLDGKVIVGTGSLGGLSNPWVARLP